MASNRLRFEIAAASLPQLPLESVPDLYGQTRYPKGHPKGGQFKPKNGGDGQTPQANGTAPKQGKLSRAKAAIADKLMGLAQKLGLVRPKSDVPLPKGMKLPKGYQLGGGRPGVLSAGGGKIDAELVVEKGDLKLTHYRSPMEAINNKVLAVYTEIDGENKSDPNFSEVHSTASYATRKPAKEVGMKGREVIEYSFEVDGSLNQSEYSDPAIAREIMNAVRTDFYRAMDKVNDNEVVAVYPWNGDDKGKGRTVAYRRMGFGTPNKRGYMAAVKLGNKLYPIDPQ